MTIRSLTTAVIAAGALVLAAGTTATASTTSSTSPTRGTSATTAKEPQVIHDDDLKVQSVTVHTSFEYHDFGKPVDVAAPAADDVLEMSDPLQFGQLLQGGG